MISRREFLALGAGAAGSTIVASCSKDLHLSRLAMVDTRKPTVVALSGVPRHEIRHLEATMAATRRAAEAATDFAWLSRGDSVLLKVACNSGNEFPATTDSSAVRGMIALLKEKGAARVIVADMSGVEYLRFGRDRTTGSTMDLMGLSGLAGAVKDAGGELHAFENDGWDAFYEDKPTTGTHWKSGIMMPNILKTVDHIILMPRCSRHQLVGSSLGMKAAVGWWRFDSRLEYHRDAGTLQEKTAESNTVPTLLEKQRLVLTSATRVQVSFGPDVGHVHVPDTGLIIASESLLAHDMVSMAWLFENRAMIPTSRLRAMTDPYQSELTVDLGNRVLCKWLGGSSDALGAEQLTRHNIGNIWQDRVLHRAMQINGGAPRIELQPATPAVGLSLLRGLQAQLT